MKVSVFSFIAALTCLVMHVSCCPPEAKNLVLADEMGLQICQNNFNPDHVCVDDCLQCYSYCRGQGKIGNFIVDDVGSPLCVCTDKSSAIAATTSYSVVAVAIVIISFCTT